MNIPSINNMKEHIEEQIKDSGISDVGKNISYYDWLTTNFANKTMFRLSEEDIIPYRGQWTANYTDFKYINVLNEQVNFEPKVDSSIDRLKKDTKINSYDFQTYCKQKIRVSSFTSNQKKTHTEKAISQFFRSYKMIR